MQPWQNLHCQDTQAVWHHELALCMGVKRSTATITPYLKEVRQKYSCSSVQSSLRKPRTRGNREHDQLGLAKSYTSTMQMG